jgi:UPF0716 protein FxsA
MWLFFAFLAVPLIEIALFIQVGGAIGLGWTLAIVVATAVLGAMLVRTQGVLALDELRRSFNEMRDPSEPLAHGAMILFSGALLLTPGFFTDALGFLLLVPAVRSALFRSLRSRVRVQSFSTGARQENYAARPRPGQEDVIEGEYTDLSEKREPGRRPSGWTDH